MHALRCKHGKLTLDTVITRQCTNGFDFKLSGFCNAADYSRNKGDTESTKNILDLTKAKQATKMFDSEIL